MAPPSRVPAAGSLAGYGPAAGGDVADLPAAYVTAWTPPKEPARAPRPAAPVPPGKADAAAAYVHARITGIAEDLAAREPGGRNTAIYTAALKVGSTLGAARSTPGAENAAAAWSDEAAADALLAAAGRNGYVAGHSAAAARSAIRSGLRNGLRSPRPLPDFTSRPALHAPERGRAPEQMGPGAGEQARARPPAAARKSPAASDRRGSVSSARPAGTSSRDGPTGTPSEIGDSVAATLRAAGFKPSGQGHGSPDEPEGFVLQRSPDGRIVIQHTAIAQPAGGVPPWDRAGQMLDRYARNLRGAGYDITRSDPASLTVRGPSPSPHARMGRIKAAPTRITGPWLTGRPPPRTLPAVQGISSAPAGSPTGPPHSTRPALSCGSGTAPRSTPSASSTRQRPPELRAIRRGHTSSSGTPPGWTRA